MKTYTTKEAAKKLCVSRLTLQRWIASGKITAPKKQKIGGGSFRLWSRADILRVRKQISKPKAK